MPEQAAPATNEVVTHATTSEDGVAHATVVLTEHSDKRDKVIKCDVRQAIPIIFLPGVMGTLLRRKGKNSESVWSPPNDDTFFSAAGALFPVLGWKSKNAQTRQTQLNPDEAEVDDQGPINVGSSGITEDLARKRGWGELHRTSYHNFLAWLQVEVDKPIDEHGPLGVWKNGQMDCEPEKSNVPTHENRQPGGGHYVPPACDNVPRKPILTTSPADFGAVKKADAVSADSDEFKQFCNFKYIVYAVGYNWLQSNLKSAEDVYKRIDEICEQLDAPKAIVITHSMGGIVARAIATQVEGGADRIYGVVHGAQPATGAPMAAKRFRTGAEGFVGGSLFGNNDAEWTAVAANSPAALELMPMPDYRDGNPWWFVRRSPADADAYAYSRLSDDEKAKADAERNVLALPKPGSDSATDIYTNPAWYGMLPVPGLLDPAGLVKRKLGEQGQVITPNNAGDKLRIAYGITLQKVVNFQTKLINNYHPNTYAFYGDGELLNGQKPSESAKTLRAWGQVVWQGPLPAGATEYDLRAATVLDDNGEGTVTISIRGETVTLKIQPATEKGDGTVPYWSSSAQARGVAPDPTLQGKANGVQQAFKQGGFDHQMCYDHPWSRWATLYSLVQIAQELPRECKA